MKYNIEDIAIFSKLKPRIVKAMKTKITKTDTLSNRST